MTFWNTLSAVLVALAIYNLLDLAIGAVQTLIRNKKINRILDELDEFWAEQELAKKPVRKKAVAKKK